MTSQPKFQANGHSGFTLLEALLTLSMSVVLMGLISFAFRFYTGEMDDSDQEIRRMQLVTAVMQMIEDDLRSTLHTQPVDTAGLEALLSSVAGGADAGGADAGGADAGGVAGADQDLPPEDGEALLIEDTGTATDLALGTAVLETPGLIGNEFQIQVDVSQLPRLEEYIPMLDASVASLDDVPSDIKTIAYFVQPPGTTTGVSDPMASVGQDVAAVDVSQSGGLVRRSLDRAASIHATLNGGLTRLTQTGDLLAPEVAALEFEYWDGMMWQIQWSSDEMGELPLAVKVTMTMATQSTNPLTDAQSRTFQHIIRLPMARPIDTSDSTLAGTGL